MVHLMSVEEAFDGHCILISVYLLLITDLLSISLSDYSKHVLIFTEMLQVW